jgi:ribosomal protein L29
MEEVDAELTSELLELRRELVELRPQADDSNLGSRSEE